MALDEQLRQLAEHVPAPPACDVSAVYGRGRRRRRLRQAMVVGAATAVVGLVGVGIAALTDGTSGIPEVADQPAGVNEPEGEPHDGRPSGMPDDWPVIVGPPAVTVSGSDPFEWVAVVSPGEDGRWCATARRGSATVGVGDLTGQACDELVTPRQLGDVNGFGTGGSSVAAAPSGEPAHGLSWGFAPAAAEQVVVLFTDGTRRPAALADESTGGGRLWGIGYEHTQVLAVEAHADGRVMAGRIPATAIPADGPVSTPREVFGDRLTRQDADAFTDEQQAVFELRDDDELYRLPTDGTDRTVGIRARDGLVPLMFATDCHLLDQVDLPEGWMGLCLEYTDPDQGRVRGLFPHGTRNGG